MKNLNLPYTNYAVRQYPNLIHDYDNLLTFCKAENIPVVMLWASYTEYPKAIEFIQKYQGSVFAAVVDSEEEFSILKGIGIQGCVSNVLMEK